MYTYVYLSLLALTQLHNYIPLHINVIYALPYLAMA